MDREQAMFLARARVGRGGYVLLNDGHFILAHDENHPLDCGGGQLLGRCEITPANPDGTAPVGRYELHDGVWRVVLLGPSGERQLLGEFCDGIEAAVELWMVRNHRPTGFSNSASGHLG